MIPTFPDFKKIELEDKDEIQSFTNQFLPYSDFNFTNLWAWNTASERMVSILNKNLVVLFSDYITSELSLSFLGSNDCLDTAKELINYANTISIKPILKNIPELVTKQLVKQNALVTKADVNNFDYIYSTNDLSLLNGAKFKAKRHLVQRFEKEYPDAHFKACDLTDVEIQKQIITVLRRWENQKISEQKPYNIQREETAIKRLLMSAKKHNLILSCVYLNADLIAFGIDELLAHGYAISHFFKADTSHRGVYEFLNVKSAKYLQEHGALLWNWEQDLGIEGIRSSKKNYRPIAFLKKYKIYASSKLQQ